MDVSKRRLQATASQLVVDNGRVLHEWEIRKTQTTAPGAHRAFQT